MKLTFTKSFVKDYQRLPSNIQTRVDKQLAYLLENFHHPSLNLKKMKDPRNIWEGRISRSYRFTFQIEDDLYILRRADTHDILEKP